VKGKEQLATWVDAPIRRRLRVYAAVSSTTITDVVSAALDRYLPALPDMVRADNAAAGQPAASEAMILPTCKSALLALNVGDSGAAR
jgi:hypothetical protein